MELEQAVAAFERNGFTVSCFETAEEAAGYLCGCLHGRSIGFGDSLTFRQMNLYERLCTDNQVTDPMHPDSEKDFNQTAMECLTTEIFITSVNALSQTGELVNIDGTGNRVAGSLFGHKTVYFVAGINKLAPTLADAVWRARNIAAPRNAKRLKKATPCAKKGDRCYDCDSPERICNGMIIHHKKMSGMEMELIFIQQELGF